MALFKADTKLGVFYLFFYCALVFVHTLRVFLFFSPNPFLVYTQFHTNILSSPFFLMFSPHSLRVKHVPRRYVCIIR